MGTKFETINDYNLSNDIETEKIIQWLRSHKGTYKNIKRLTKEEKNQLAREWSIEEQDKIAKEFGFK